MEREISIILKIKGAREAKKAINDVFDGQTKTLVEGFNKSTKKTGDNMKRVDRHSRRAGKSMDGFTKVLGRGMAALYLYNRAWSTFGRNFEMGLNLERAADQFERHVGRVSEMLPTLRSATRGIISDFDLLKTANRAFQQGIQPQQMGKAFSLATSAAQKLGLNASEAINTITNAITKQDEGALNTLGIVTKVNQAYKTQAALIAKNGGVMSNAMSIQLRQNLIMQELQKRFGGVNAAQEDGLMILERFRASWKNFRAAIGDTLGIALRPLTQALTGVLDVTTSLLNKLNDTGGFQKFVKIASSLAIVFGSMKFIAGARSLMSLFGFFGTSKASGAVKLLSKTGKGIDKLGAIFFKTVPGIRNFIAALSFTRPALARVLAFIPGIGIALSAVTILFDPFVDMLKLAWNSSKVLFQLLSNFDDNSGLSKVLKKDADSLGSFYNVIETVAKGLMWVWAPIKGVIQGVTEPITDIINIVGSAYNRISELTNGFWGFAKTGPAVTSTLDMITNSVKYLVKGLGLVASLVALVVPGFQAIGAAGTIGFGTSLAKDLGANEALSGMFNSFSSPEPAQAGAIPQPTMSTQQSSPEPRSTNLDYSNDMPDWAKAIVKELKGQTTLMETDAQKKDIEKSQNNAMSNILIRR